MNSSETLFTEYDAQHHHDYSKSLIECIHYELRAIRAFQSMPYREYVQQRCDYLNNVAGNHAEHIVQYLTTYTPRIAVYAGSFNPFHLGHLNIVQKAAAIFDKVIIARGVNPEKESLREQWNIDALKSFESADFTGLLTKFIEKHSAYGDITLVKGLRNGDDLDYEVNQLRFMEEMYPLLKVVFIQCDKEYEHISSTALRNLETIEKGLSKQFIP